MRDKTKNISLTVVFLVALGALFTGIFVFQHVHSMPKKDFTHFNGTYLEHPREVNAFQLTGTDHKTFDNTSLHGQWTFIFFGFTNCGSICPTTMAELSKMYRLLNEKGVKNLPRVVMISVDPTRDTVSKLNQYVRSFQPAFYGARGEEAIIKAMTKEMGIAYTKVANQDGIIPENYNIEHSGALMLFNPQGQLNAFFTGPHSAAHLANDYLTLIS